MVLSFQRRCVGLFGWPPFGPHALALVSPAQNLDSMAPIVTPQASVEAAEDDGSRSPYYDVSRPEAAAQPAVAQPAAASLSHTMSQAQQDEQYARQLVRKHDA